MSKKIRMKKGIILILFWLFSIVLIFNKTYANFSSGTSFGTGVSRGSIALGDINGDGYLDLITTGWDDNKYRLDKYTNNGAGIFSGPITNWGIGVYYSSIALGDIDCDGDLDLIVTGSNSSGP